MKRLRGQPMRLLFILTILVGSIVADDNPSNAYKMHICAFHIAKDDPNIVIETQHYCSALHDNLFQCLLYETTQSKVTPKLLGVEYVISNELYQKLTPEEKTFWHPHDFEVREGLLALIDTSKQEEESTMKVLVNSWGKTWHTWPDPKSDLPLGPPLLMWSATKQGDVPQNLIDKRDQRFKINTLELKKERDRYLPKE